MKIRDKLFSVFTEILILKTSSSSAAAAAASSSSSSSSSKNNIKYKKIMTLLSLHFTENSTEEMMTAILSLNKKKVNTKQYALHGQMLPETKALLLNFYKAHNEKLNELLGIDMEFDPMVKR
jgi:hypothetical protein